MGTRCEKKNLELQESFRRLLVCRLALDREAAARRRSRAQEGISRQKRL